MTNSDIFVMCSILALDKTKFPQASNTWKRQILIEMSTRELVTYLIRLLEKSTIFCINKKEKENLLPILQNYLIRFRFFYFVHFSKKYPKDLHFFSSKYVNAMAIKALYLIAGA
jgi:hypothetical protein